MKNLKFKAIDRDQLMIDLKAHIFSSYIIFGIIFMLRLNLPSSFIRR